MTTKAASQATFESGAVRSELRPRFDLNPREALEALARRLELGAQKYGEGNWQKGVNDIAFRRETMNHLIAHCLEYQLNGDVNDDNTGAIMANAAFLAYFETHMPLAKLRENMSKQAR